MFTPKNTNPPLRAGDSKNTSLENDELSPQDCENARRLINFYRSREASNREIFKAIPELLNEKEIKKGKKLNTESTYAENLEYLEKTNIVHIKWHIGYQGKKNEKNREQIEETYIKNLTPATVKKMSIFFQTLEEYKRLQRVRKK